MPDKQFLALYDCRSKQEYIYRTNRMREITGASELIASLYGQFIDSMGGALVGDWREQIDAPYEIPEGRDGVVVYEGGGNLCVLYRSREAYVTANRMFSRLVLDKAYSLSMVTACVESTCDCESNSNAAFENDLKAVYAQLDKKKRIGYAGVPCNVLPYTQVDRVTFQAIADKTDSELSRESKMKREAYEKKSDENPEWALRGRFIDDLGTEKGEDSLIAVIYSDGNSIGEQLKLNGTSLDGMRRFSLEVHRKLVEDTENEVKSELNQLEEHLRNQLKDEIGKGGKSKADAEERISRITNYRIIIDHGDEITLICNAHAAPLVADAYFRALSSSGYHACMGIAFCHSHDPFSEVYKIAEELCESGKKRNRKVMQKCGANADYIDFHFCRSGITGTLEQIRDAQEAELTSRPYRIEDEYQRFIHVGRILNSSFLKRSDLKELNRSILRGGSWYEIEFERLKAKSKEAISSIEALFESANADGEMRKVLFDVTSLWDVFDIFFAQNAEGGVIANA